MSDLDPDEAFAMEHEADRLASEQRFEGLADRYDQLAGAAERHHEEHMARLDRIAAALERLAGGAL